MNLKNFRREAYIIIYVSNRYKHRENLISTESRKREQKMGSQKNYSQSRRRGEEET
jgi:hypothetical protein